VTNPPQYTITPYTPADHDALIALAPRLVENSPPWFDHNAFLAAALGWVESSIKNIGPDQAVYVARDPDQHAIGFITVTRTKHFTGADHAYIGELVVAQQHENKGIGRALISTAEAWATAHNLTYITLETGGYNNTQVRNFYAHLGYHEDTVKLAKRLPPR
jgi:GNAT superfamily N-acetyltransferase